MPLIVIINPQSGARSTKAFFDEHVHPLLKENNIVPDRVVETERQNHAGEILADFLREHDGIVDVILGSGDGTLNESMTVLAQTVFTGARAQSSRVHFALVPCGTANALYSTLFPPPQDPTDAAYRLQSVKALIQRSKTVPLHLAITTLSSAPALRKRPEVKISAVVVSTSLHASILKDSEALRAEIPGIERFKVAAEQNSTKWYNSHVKLLPAPGAQVVQIYDPLTKTFVAHPDSDADGEPIVDLHGPFSYFLATVNVDRLEPAFNIAPLASRIPPTEATLDIVIIRPLRSPVLEDDTPDARASFVPTLYKVLGAAYQAGSHVDLRYQEDGSAGTEGDGLPVCEYIRAGGFEWLPDFDDADAHALCTDGAISVIESDGRAVCSAASPDGQGGFMVWSNVVVPLLLTAMLSMELGSEVFVIRASQNEASQDLIALGTSHSVEVFSIDQNKFTPVAAFHVGQRITAIAFSPRSVSPIRSQDDWVIELVAASSNFGLHLLTKTPMLDESVYSFGGGLSGHHACVNDIAFCGGLGEDSARFVATVSNDKLLFVWDLDPSPASPKSSPSLSMSPERAQPTAYTIAFRHALHSVCSHRSSSREFVVADARGSIFLTDWRSDPDEADIDSWRQVELVDPHALATSTILGGSASWRIDNPDIVGAVFGSRYSIWDISKLQGGKPLLSGVCQEGSDRFRWCPTLPIFAISSCSPAKGATISIHTLTPSTTTIALAPRPHFIRDFDWISSPTPRIAAATGRRVILFDVTVDT
ncbi:DEAD-box protein abstrakt [Mycena kentingensis (nom. inval.)]|nr:DEAD-box protein abstrakt [Mycena kentingensis (nom. inval.)]